MKILNLLTAALAAIPSALGSPLRRDFNISSFNPGPVCTSTLPVVNISASNPQLGFAEFLSSGARAPWPVDDSGTRTVRYCYVDKNAQTVLDESFKAAQKIWIDALGGPAGAQSRHGLAFREVNDGTGELYCYIGYQDFNNRGSWNIAVEDDVLAIHLSTKREMKSMVGYLPVERWSLDIEGRHYMLLSPVPPDQTWYTAHEVTVQILSL